MQSPVRVPPRPLDPPWLPTVNSCTRPSRTATIARKYRCLAFSQDCFPWPQGVFKAYQIALREHADNCQTVK